MVYTANKIIQIRKRDDRIVDFSQDKITAAIFNAMRAIGEPDQEKAEVLSGIQQTAELTLEKSSELVTRVRLLRDILGRPDDDPELVEAIEFSEKS